MRIDRAALPFVLVAAVPAAVAALAGARLTALGLVLVPTAIAWFFRDPERTAPEDPSAVLAPADGRVMHAGPARPADAPPGDWQQVVIFLSPLDVHINRAPVAGRVTRKEYVAGSFLPAYRDGAGRNEHSEIWIDHDGQTVVVRQIVGVMARRVVCRVGRGDTVAAGGRIGLMKFGSRMDVFLPPGATLTVAVGQGVRAAETVIARLGRENMGPA
jgi:phosphatidylserine decarboxylase